MTVLLKHNFGKAGGGGIILKLIYRVILRTIQEEHHIGILLNRAGFTQVGQHRAFASATGFHSAIQLRQDNHRHIQFLGQCF